MVERDRNRQQGSRRRRFPGDESPHLSGERTADRAGLSIYVLLASLEMGDRGTRHGEKTFRTKKFLKHEDGGLLVQNKIRVAFSIAHHTIPRYHPIHQSVGSWQGRKITSRRSENRRLLPMQNVNMRGTCTLGLGVSLSFVSLCMSLKYMHSLPFGHPPVCLAPLAPRACRWHSPWAMPPLPAQ